MNKISCFQNVPNNYYNNNFFHSSLCTTVFTLNNLLSFPFANLFFYLFPNIFTLRYNFFLLRILYEIFQSLFSLCVCVVYFQIHIFLNDIKCINVNGAVILFLVYSTKKKEREKK